MKKCVKYSAIAASILIALTGCTFDGDEGDQGSVGEKGAVGDQGTPGIDGEVGVGKLTRLATVPLGAEVTGIFVSEEGDLFFNVQHPSDANTITDEFNGKAFNKGTVGVLAGLNVNQLPVNLVDVPVPDTDEEKETVQVAYGQYQVLGQAGDTFDGKLAEGLGSIRAIEGDAEVLLSHNPDFNGFLSTGDGEGYLFSNWESIPGGMSRMKVSKDDFGRWSVGDAMMLDFDSLGGTAANCFGSVSPWGTPLTSEEWVVYSEVDTTSIADWNDPDNDDGRINDLRTFTAPASPNPYRYGYIVEITQPTSEAPVPVKHFALGRYEHENSTVMPDGKTVYLSQDDTGGVLFKFVADEANDLSAGTLYGAKLTQDKGSTEPLTTGFDIQWIPLGHGDNGTIEAWIAQYDAITTDDYVDGQTNYLSVADVEAWAKGDAKYPSLENGGGSTTAGQDMDDRAVFIESRAAAKAKGATAEFRKLEGISINAKRAAEAVEGKDLIADEQVDAAYVYFAIADLDKTMIDGEGDIQLSSRVKDCGGVYRMKLEANYDVSRIEPVTMGATDGGGICDSNNLSQPDNVIVLDDGRIVIGEDGHQDNNTLWLYNPVSK